MTSPRHSVCLAVGVGLLLAVSTSLADAEFSGHIKTRLLGERFPATSVFNTTAGSTTSALESDLRLNAAYADGPWSIDAAGQLSVSLGERLEVFGNASTPTGFGSNRLDPDRRRLLDLSDVIVDDRRFNSLHRIDRLAIGFARDNVVLRLGRQAISWGNGLLFSPMDIVNPFDPTAIDTEYKAGDDMLYGQWLQKNGDDLQAAIVFRRSTVDGAPDSGAGTAALKYHGVAGSTEFDVLLAKNRDRTTWGLGGNVAVGGAVLRGDVVTTDTASGRATEMVANLSYSWVWWEKNFSGLVEFFHSGFGQKDGRYSLADLAANPQLLARLQRGESFTLGRNYLAGGVTIEVSPLLNVAPNVFWNLDDNSALARIVARRSVSNNAELIGAVNVPLGPSGSEFGGIASAVPGRYFSTDLSLFVQFGWYF